MKTKVIHRRNANKDDREYTPGAEEVIIRADIDNPKVKNAVYIGRGADGAREITCRLSEAALIETTVDIIMAAWDQAGETEI